MIDTDTHENYRARITAYVSSEMEQVEQELARATKAGADIADLVGLISDGKGDVGKMGRLATVIPRDLARKMTVCLSAEEFPEFAQALEQIEAPVPGSFVILLLLEEGPAFTAYGYSSVPTSPLFKLTPGERAKA